MDDFIIYLENNGLRHNTIVGYIQKIQSLVRRAGQYNYAVDTTFDEIDLREEPTNAVFLSIMRSRGYTTINLSNRIRESERAYTGHVCHWFLTALRYSDYSRLTSQNMINGYIVIRTKKTNWMLRSRHMIM